MTSGEIYRQTSDRPASLFLGPALVPVLQHLSLLSCDPTPRTQVEKGDPEAGACVPNLRTKEARAVRL